jgi:hypothetical protein
MKRIGIRWVNEETMSMRQGFKITAAAAGLVIIGMAAGALHGQAQGTKSSYISVNEEEFRTAFARMSAAKPQVMKRQAGSPQRAGRPQRSSQRRRHHESRQADPGGRPRQAARGSDVGGAGENDVDFTAGRLRLDKGRVIIS